MRPSVPLGRIAGVRFDANLSVLVFVAILVIDLVLDASRSSCRADARRVSGRRHSDHRLVPRLGARTRTGARGPGPPQPDPRAVVTDESNTVVGIVSPSDVSRAMQLAIRSHPTYPSTV